jgi:hypothetical protein
MNGTTTSADVAQLKTQKKNLPKKLMESLFALQDFMDDQTGLDNVKEGTYKEFCDKISDNQNGEGIFDIIKELLALLDKSVLPQVTKLTDPEQRRKRKTEAEILLLCQDPTNEDWNFCKTCSRPLGSGDKGLVEHRKRDICQSIGLGRQATLMNKSRISMVNASHIYDKKINQTSTLAQEEKELASKMLAGDTSVSHHFEEGYDVSIPDDVLNA